MQFSHADPWHFLNGDPVFYSPDRKHFVEYGKLSEIVMGGPLIGSCYLRDENDEHLVAEYCGGPPCWEKSGLQFAIPVWRRHWLKGWIQRMAVGDIEKKKLVLFKPLFRVLAIKRFNEGIIEATDSPIHKPRSVRFCISNEEVFKTTSLQRRTTLCGTSVRRNSC